MYATSYIKAKDVADAVSHLNGADEGKLLAGGQTLIPTLKQRLAASDCLVDLSDANLSGISDEGDSIRIGAMTRHVEVETSDLVKKAIPALAALAGGIGDRQVRNCGTIGGSVANNDPSACYPSAVMALGATIHTDKRDIAAADYFTGMFETDLDEAEVITAISFPKPEAAAYVKFPNPASRYAMVGVFVAKSASGVAVAITGAGQDGVFRHDGLEAALNISFKADAVDEVAVDDSSLMNDMHASADYRAHLIVEMTKRAVAAC
ncbi:MAG: xanthine dehydrogenase family protein subunit M [Pseudomonadota bacterium]|nr:xanthine dehydrogenase family protein subunit M [Pseudomonadota bacterium]